MKTRLAPHLIIVLGGLTALSFALPTVPCSAAYGTDMPAHQVVVCYFHRTVRCPACKMVGSHIQEAVQTGFPAQVKDGTVKVVMVDFQDPRNQPYVQAYHVSGPLSVILDIHDGKVTAWKPVPRLWSLLAKKSDFFRYVQTEVQGYLHPQAAAGQ